MGKFDAAAAAAIKEAAAIKNYKPMIALANNQLDYIIGLSDLVSFNEVDGDFSVYFLNRIYRIILNFKKILNNNGISYTTKDYVYIKYVQIIDEFIDYIHGEAKKVYRLSPKDRINLKVSLMEGINRLLEERLSSWSLMESHVVYVKGFIEQHEDDLRLVSSEKFDTSLAELEMFLEANAKALSGYSYMGELVSEKDMNESAESKARFDPNTKNKKVIKPTDFELNFVQDKNK